MAENLNIQSSQVSILNSYNIEQFQHAKVQNDACTTTHDKLLHYA